MKGLIFGVDSRGLRRTIPRAGYWGYYSDYKYWSIEPGYTKRINKYGIKTIFFQVHGGRFYDISGKSLGYYFVPFYLRIRSMKEHNFRVYYNIGNERVQIYGEEDQLEWTENFFKGHKVATSFSYKGNRFYSFEIHLSYDLGPVYNSEYTEAYDGKSVELGSEFELKPTSFLNFILNLSYNKQNIRATGEELFEGILTSANIRYQISRQVFITSYIQHDSHYKRLNLDIVLGIELGMANLIFLSYKRFYPLEGSPFEDKARSFVIKASYLLRF